MLAFGDLGQLQGEPSGVVERRHLGQTYRRGSVRRVAPERPPRSPRRRAITVGIGGPQRGRLVVEPWRIGAWKHPARSTRRRRSPSSDSSQPVGSRWISSGHCRSHGSTPMKCRVEVGAPEVPGWTVEPGRRGRPGTAAGRSRRAAPPRSMPRGGSSASRRTSTRAPALGRIGRLAPRTDEDGDLVEDEGLSHTSLPRLTHDTSTE